MNNPQSVTLKNGVKLYPFTSPDELIDFAEQEKKILVAVCAEKITHATEKTKAIMERNIAYCDGVGAVMVMRRKGYNTCKIAGCELWLRIVERFAPKGYSFYLVGGRQQVIDATADKLKSQYPNINIVNYRNGYIADETEKQALLDDIADKKPDVVFVAMGSPRQELLMEEMQARHPAIYQGLGGSIDVYTGFVKRAPKWWIDHNLESAYRLLIDPKRLVRHLVLFRFIYLMIFNKL